MDLLILKFMEENFIINNKIFFKLPTSVILLDYLSIINLFSIKFKLEFISI
jgi:hypothetical protein